MDAAQVPVAGRPASSGSGCFVARFACQQPLYGRLRRIAAEQDLRDRIDDRHRDVMLLRKQLHRLYATHAFGHMAEFGHDGIERLALRKAKADLAIA